MNAFLLSCWQMGWNSVSPNAKILHLGQSSVEHRYYLGEEWLESRPAEKGLGVLASGSLSVRQLCVLAARRADHTLGCIKHSTASKKRWLSHCIQHRCSLTWSAVCTSGSHSVRLLRHSGASRGEQQSWWWGWKHVLWGAAAWGREVEREALSSSPGIRW